jgi:hypothetical protein
MLILYQSRGFFPAPTAFLKLTSVYVLLSPFFGDIPHAFMFKFSLIPVAAQERALGAVKKIWVSVWGAQMPIKRFVCACKLSSGGNPTVVE